MKNRIFTPFLLFVKSEYTISINEILDLRVNTLPLLDGHAYAYVSTAVLSSILTPFHTAQN